MRPDSLEKKFEEEDQIFQNPENSFAASCALLNNFLIKVKLEGKLTYPDSSELVVALDEAVNGRMNVDSHSRKFYMMIDVKNLTAVDYRSKKLVSNHLKKYCNHPFIKHVALISSNYLLFSLGAYYDKIIGSAPVSFHRNEETALKTIFRRRNSRDDLWHDYRENGEMDLKTGKEIFFQGRRLKVESDDAWNAVDYVERYRHTLFLVDRKILVIEARGVLKFKHIFLQAESFRKVRKFVPEQNLKLILDLSEVDGVERSVKKLYKAKADELYENFGNIYVILSKPLQFEFRMFFFFKREHHIFKPVDDLDDALKLIYGKKPALDSIGKAGEYNELSPESIMKLPRKELQQLAATLLEENRGLKENQKEKTSRLFEIISRISWDEDFKPSPILIENEDDPFFDLYNSVSLLQQDVYEMVEELKELNRDLEKKIEDRTKTIADKEANLSSLIENTKDLICSVDRNYNLLVANRAYKQFILETYNEELKPGDNLLAGLHEDIVSYWKPYYDRALRGESFSLIESRLVNDRTAFFEMSFHPIWTQGREVAGFSVFIHEVTQQKEAEQTLRKSQQLLTSINHNIKEGIYRSDENGKIIYVNPAFIEIFGYESAEEITENPFSSLYWNQDDRMKLLETIKTEGRITNVEVKFKKKDGSFFWGLITSCIDVDEKGNEFFDGAIRDVTKIRETDIKLKDQNEELKKVNTELDRFVYSASHDLRAPLLSILGLISVARIEKTPEGLEGCFNMMEKSIKKLDRFIQDIINYSRNKRLLINRDRINFQAILPEIFRDLQYLKKSPSVDKRLSINTPADFYTDLRRLKIILYNLVSNAIIYSASLREPYLEVAVETNERFATVVVEDNGQGIPEEHLENIFNMFYRASEEEAGSGLGLYIVKETIETLNGSISVRSRTGKGTTFTFTLPNLK